MNPNLYSEYGSSLDTDLTSLRKNILNRPNNWACRVQIIFLVSRVIPVSSNVSNNSTKFILIKHTFNKKTVQAGVGQKSLGSATNILSDLKLKS